MPSTSASRIVNATREQVWAVLSDIANARRWNRAWSTIEFTSKQTHGPDTRFRTGAEDGNTYEFVISAWVAPEYIEFTPVRDEAERYGIMLESQAFHLAPAAENETLVELIARSSTHGLRGWLTGLFFWRGYQKQGLVHALDALNTIFEPQEPGERPEEASPATD